MKEVTSYEAKRPEDEVIAGVAWGKPEWIPSPAYWARLARHAVLPLRLFGRSATLQEELGFCLLGGHGITAEVNLAAHKRLKDEGVYDAGKLPSVDVIRALLLEPLKIDHRAVKYRFPNQKAERISRALRALSSNQISYDDGCKLRDFLLTIPGVGPKTASWVARNWLDSDDVAILDIHVERAGRIIGLFDAGHRLPRDYAKMEEKFLLFCEGLEVRPSVLDAIIWSTMRKLPRMSVT